MQMRKVSVALLVLSIGTTASPWTHQIGKSDHDYARGGLKAKRVVLPGGYLGLWSDQGLHLGYPSLTSEFYASCEVTTWKLNKSNQTDLMDKMIQDAGLQDLG
eukprot:Skav223648  [mRNA]  locus=scaffold46:711295:711603:- [translate_table: standard]